MRPRRDSHIVRTTLIVFFIALIGYALFEAQGMLYGPAINVPAEAILVSDRFTIIKGRAERITELRLNGKTISVTESGDFEEPFVLSPGSNRLILEARDARGRSTKKTIDIIFSPVAESTLPGTPEMGT